MGTKGNLREGRQGGDHGGFLLHLTLQWQARRFTLSLLQTGISHVGLADLFHISHTLGAGDQKVTSGGSSERIKKKPKDAREAG